MKKIFFLMRIICSLAWVSFPTALLGKSTDQVDRILIEKSKRTLTLYQNDKILKSYRVSLGWEPVGPKTQQGDGKTPEGKYVIEDRNKHSQYHRALKISYPNAHDRKQAKNHGVDPGGLIMIHGLPNGFPDWGAAHRLVDWTAGCIAVTNDEIEEIWSLVPDGTPVEIVP